jgi:exosortase A
MQLEPALQGLRHPLRGWKLARAWVTPLRLLACVWLGLAALTFPDWAAMAGQWWNSSTFNHVLLVPLILGWLVHQRAGELARIEPESWWPGLIPFGGAVLCWVLGAFSGLTLARELGAVGMLMTSALVLLGPRAGAGLAFPLGYMLFLVPFGEELVAPMQMVTARLTIALVHLSGMAARIDGVFIDTPAGLFQVAEACSGIKFLVAMVAFGALVANVCFRSWWRRAGFMLLSFAVPVLANGVRAWGTVYIAQFVGADRATGIDHVIYGWVFFAVVIALILAMAWPFFDRARDDAMIDPEAIDASSRLAALAAWRIRPAAALAGLAAIALAGQAWAMAADSLLAPVPRQIFLPEVPGWHRVDYSPQEAWEPRAQGAEHRLLGSYADEHGHRVDVFLALYASQEEGKEAGGFGEGALIPDSQWQWQSPGPDVEGARSDRLMAAGRVERLAETWYRTGKLTTGSNARLKLANMADRLLLRARPTMMLILSAEERAGHPSAAESIDTFRRSTGTPGAWMDRVAGIG